MLMRRMLALCAVLAGMAMLVGFTACTQADVLALQGTLKNVDSVSGNVTVTLKDGTTQTFNFNNVKVDTIKQALGNATLEIGDNVTVKIRQHRVEEVHAACAELDGIIKSVGADNVTVTTQKHGDVTLRVNAQTKIVVGDNSTAALSDLEAGQQVEAKYDVSTNTALRITVETDRGGRLAQVEGLVKAVDLNAKTVTIDFGHGDNVTLNVTANTTIRIADHRTGSLGDIKVGQQVHAAYDKTTKNAVSVTLQAQNEDREGRQNQNSQGDNRQGRKGEHDD